MSTANEPDALQAMTRTAQIIVGALIQGVVLFLAIVLFISEPPKPEGGPGMMGESGPFGEGSGELTPVAVENFQMLRQRQTADDLSGEDAPESGGRLRGRVNLLNWDGKGSPRGLFPKKRSEGDR